MTNPELFELAGIAGNTDPRLVLQNAVERLPACESDSAACDAAMAALSALVEPLKEAIANLGVAGAGIRAHPRRFPRGAEGIPKLLDDRPSPEPR